MFSCLKMLFVGLMIFCIPGLGSAAQISTITADGDSRDWTVLFDSPGSYAQGVASNGTDLWWIFGGLKKIEPTTGAVLASLPLHIYDAQGLTFDGSGALWMVSYADDKVYQIDLTNGDPITSWATGGQGPTGIAYISDVNAFLIADEDGYLYLHDSAGNLIDTREAPWGTWTTNIYYAMEKGIDFLYVTHFGTQTIEKYNYETLDLVSTIDGPSSYSKGITSDGTFLYVSDYYGKGFKKLLPDQCTCDVNGDGDFDLQDVIMEFRENGLVSAVRLFISCRESASMEESVRIEEYFERFGNR